MANHLADKALQNSWPLFMFPLEGTAPFTQNYMSSQFMHPPSSQWRVTYWNMLQMYLIFYIYVIVSFLNRILFIVQIFKWFREARAWNSVVLSWIHFYFHVFHKIMFWYTLNYICNFQITRWIHSWSSFSYCQDLLVSLPHSFPFSYTQLRPLQHHIAHCPWKDKWITCNDNYRSSLV